jgi:hypothetical protein
MSVLLKEDNKKYVIDWESPSSELKVMEFEPTTWNAQSQQYDYSLINTYTFGGGAISPVWGSWYDTTTQYTTADTPTPMYFDSIVNQSGILKKFGSNFEVQTSGWYNVQFSAQLDQDAGSGQHIFIWLRKNGVDVPNTAGEVAVQGTTAESIPSWNYFIDLNDGDYIQIMYLVTDAGTHLKAQAADALKPAIPSVILTMNKIANL